MIHLYPHFKKLLLVIFLLASHTFASASSLNLSTINLLKCASASLMSTRKIRCGGFCAKSAQTYNAATIAQIKFTDHGLDKLSRYYRNIEVPSLIFRDFIEMQELYPLIADGSSPSFFRWLPAENTFICPNPGSVLFDYFAKPNSKENAKTLKDRNEGVAAITYFVHPGLVVGKSQFGPNHSLPKLRDNTSITIGDLERRTGIKYLASILDLTLEHVGLLRSMRQEMLVTLKDVYGYNEKVDDLALFFHFPYAPVTTTLHLHARLNFPTHPLDAIKSYSLNDVIQYLEDGRGIKRLILDRQRLLGGHLYNAISGSYKIIVEAGAAETDTVTNPFQVEIVH